MKCKPNPNKLENNQGKSSKQIENTQQRKINKAKKWFFENTEKFTNIVRMSKK